MLHPTACKESLLNLRQAQTGNGLFSLRSFHYSWNHFHSPSGNRLPPFAIAFSAPAGHRHAIVPPPAHGVTWKQLLIMLFRDKLRGSYYCWSTDHAVKGLNSASISVICPCSAHGCSRSSSRGQGRRSWLGRGEKLVGLDGCIHTFHPHLMAGWSRMSSKAACRFATLLQEPGFREQVLAVQGPEWTSETITKRSESKSKFEWHVVATVATLVVSRARLSSADFSSRSSWPELLSNAGRQVKPDPCTATV